MSTEITKEKFLKDLNELKDALEYPKLFMANYFNDLRNDVDIAFAPKQLEFLHDQEKKKQIDDLWQQMINRIDTFEKNCKINSCNFEPNKNRITDLKGPIELKTPFSHIYCCIGHGFFALLH